MTGDDGRLREMFQTQRAMERGRAPDFPAARRGRPAPAPRSSTVPALAIVILASLVVMAVSLRRSETRRAELELARQVMSWRSPTEFLLPDPVPGLVPMVSRIDEAPAGSPLKSLDTGGAFGPPATARSPRS